MAKLKLPRFFEDSEHRKQLLGKLKLLDCPHCGQPDNLICNGYLCGNDPTQQACAQVHRGQRILCSNRGRRRGCGRSFAIFEAGRLPGRSVDTSTLSHLLGAILRCAGAIHRAWQQGSRLFSLSTAYRLWGQIGLHQTQLRHRLCRCTGPPPCAHAEPRLQLIAHLQAAFEETDPVQAFQKHFQQTALPHF